MFFALFQKIQNTHNTLNGSSVEVLVVGTSPRRHCTVVSFNLGDIEQICRVETRRRRRRRDILSHSRHRNQVYYLGFCQVRDDRVDGRKRIDELKHVGRFSEPSEGFKIF